MSRKDSFWNAIQSKYVACNGSRVTQCHIIQVSASMFPYHFFSRKADKFGKFKETGNMRRVKNPLKRPYMMFASMKYMGGKPCEELIVLIDCFAMVS